jgi:hypothetical protein
VLHSVGPLPKNTKHSQETGIHAPSGIRTRNPSKRAAADTRLRRRGHWDRLCIMWSYLIMLSEVTGCRVECYNCFYPPDVIKMFNEGGSSERNM